MSLKAMHESKKNNPEPVILSEHLIERLDEATKVVEQEQERREQAETENQQLRISLQKQTKLLTQLCETSDNEMPKKLSEQLLSEQKQNEKLKKQLQDAAATAENDKKASDRQISQLEAEISRLERQLNYERFDKKAYLLGLESREQALKEGHEALKTDRKNFNSQVQSEARKMIQDEVAILKDKTAQCEAEKARLIAQQEANEAEQQKWVSAEKEKIEAKATQKFTEYKAKQDEQTAQERAKNERDYKSRNTALTSKVVFIIGLVVNGGLICSIVSIIGFIIAFFHGLLPFIIEDGKKIGGWIRNDWNAIFGQSFIFPNTLLPIAQLTLPLIFLIVVGIWTARDFDDRKWVVFADKVSIIFIGTGIGISAVFGKQLSEILGWNTVMFPIMVYLLYVLIRWLWEIGFIQGIFEWWKGLAPNHKGAIMWFTLMAIVIAVISRSCNKGS